MLVIVHLKVLHTLDVRHSSCGVISSIQIYCDFYKLTVNTRMLYILQIDDDTTMEFWILSCAEIYQRILGGEIYAVPQPPLDVE